MSIQSKRRGNPVDYLSASSWPKIPSYDAIKARARRPLNFMVEYFKARQTGAIPFGLIRSIQRGLLTYHYRSVPMLKHPIDMALYTDLVWHLRPRTIIEIGSGRGGSAVWFSDLLKNYNIDGKVLSIDLVPPKIEVSGIEFYYGDAANLEDNMLDYGPHPWLVIEDSSHLAKDSLAVLYHFADQLHVGDYIVVEDGNVTDMGDAHRRGGGPLAAIHQFLKDDPRFAIDRSYCDRYGHNVTANPDGWLKRVK